MSIKWESIRTFNNSQNNAFEELICQLAREEPITNKVEFRRVAAPDGGVEAYCVLDDGTEYGWQAKYFFCMGDAQWKQLKESFETTLKTHPNLTKYYICIPLDRQDPRRKDQEWFMDKWNKKVIEWIQYAKGRGRDVRIEYWGSSELIHRLSQENNAGRLHFWFSTEELTDRWFSDQVEESTKNLGKRYTPELNVELDIVRNFDAISRNSNFYRLVHKHFHDFLAKLNKFTERSMYYSGNNSSEKFECIISDLKDCFVPEDLGLEQFDINLLLSHIDNISKYLSDFEHEFIDNSDKKNDDLRYQVNEVWQAISDFSDFIKGPMLKLANSPIMILSGEAGIGKSHLLADIANHRIKSRIPCLLLLGQNFTSEDSPWAQILRNILRIDGKENVLLGALNARAEAQGERLLFIIDAINEGKGRYFWPDYLVGMINQFSKYPWLGLVLSIRSSYEKLIVPKDFFNENKITRITHSGFGSVEYQASKFFFSQYGIEQPGVPILHPEFSNPLFLKIF
ncbi:ATP-binding protein, partial [Salmonella enterica subsp. salamae]|nr:ATP-binding protein [Salmonella enterica subsp. salamae serovar Sofia]